MTDIRTITDVHFKIAATAAYQPNHTILASNSDAWLRNITSLRLRGFVFSGNAGSLPAAIFMRLGIATVDGHTSVTCLPSFNNGIAETRTLLPALSNGLISDAGRLIAVAGNNAPINMCNCRVTFETWDTITAAFIPFYDYTQVVLEFEVEVGANTKNLRIPHAI